MTRSALEDAFAHHIWATLRLIDACLVLSDEQLATNVPGTYGSILDTMRRVVGADASYLLVLSGERTPELGEEDEAALTLPEMRAVIERHDPGGE